jgi:hypothetical protein
MHNSTIFTMHNGEVRPRQNATIRVWLYQLDINRSTDMTKYYLNTNQSISVELLEFHPYFDPTGFGRACAFVKPQPALLRPELARKYQQRGVGFLEEPYIAVHERVIHEDDFQELMDWCHINHLGLRDALVIHPCPIPWPMFKKGDRVVVVDHVLRGEQDLIGQTGALFEDSQLKGKSSIVFDDPKYHQGIDGHTYPYYVVASISLCKLESGT